MPVHTNQAFVRSEASVQIRNDLRSLLDRFVLTSRSCRLRLELSDTIVACYVAGHLSREEYHAAIAEIA